MGLSQADYLAVLADVSEVQARVGSFVYLPWSIDLLEQTTIQPVALDEPDDRLATTRPR